MVYPYAAKRLGNSLWHLEETQSGVPSHKLGGKTMRTARTFFLATSSIIACAALAQSEPAAAVDQRSYARFNEAMEKVVEKFDAGGKSFKDVIDMLRQTTGVNIVVDPKLYGKLGAENVSVNMVLTDIQVKNILATFLRMYNLVADYNNQVLYISTVDEIYRGQEVVTRKYDVRRIITERPQFFHSAIAGSLEEAEIRRRGIRGWSSSAIEDFEVGRLKDRTMPETNQARFEENGEKLVKYIRTTVAPDSWATDGRVNVQFNKEGTLVVTHVLPVHLEVLKVLAGMEKE
jgi:hypothetical protein